MKQLILIKGSTKGRLQNFLVVLQAGDFQITMSEYNGSHF